VDLDGDGHLDILSGSYSRMETDMAGLFQVLYGKPDGTFRKAEVLKGTDGNPLIIPLNGQPMTENICTRPFAVDWDGDGHLDLVVGNFSGTFYWFKGEGKGRFRPKPEVIKSGGVPLRIEGNHSDPFVIDWDGDGALDLLSGSSNGGVQWARNRAGKGKPPDLGPFEWLIKPPARPIAYGQLLSEEGLVGPTSATRIWVADVNGDGKLDLLVGDSVTLIAPAKDISAAEFKKKFAAWQEAVAAASKELASATGDETKRSKASEEFNKVSNQRTEFMKEDRTGFVWLYLQK
jgi:hypothetical protein